MYKQKPRYRHVHPHAGMRGTLRACGQVLLLRSGSLQIRSHKIFPQQGLLSLSANRLDGALLTGVYLILLIVHYMPPSIIYCTASKLGTEYRCNNLPMGFSVVLIAAAPKHFKNIHNNVPATSLQANGSLCFCSTPSSQRYCTTAGYSYLSWTQHCSWCLLLQHQLHWHTALRCTI